MVYLTRGALCEPIKRKQGTKKWALPSIMRCPKRARCKMTYSSYFKWAVWMPAILLPLLFIADTLLPPVTPFGGWKQFFHMFILAFGVGAYFIFAFLASRVIDRKTEREVVRLACWAPVIFIPFYAAPWFLYGVIYLVSGHLAGLRLMVEWLAYIPYLLVAGYFCSIVTIVIYQVVKRFFRQEL